MRRLALTAAAAAVLVGCGSSHVSSSGPRPHSHYPLTGYTPVVVAAHRLDPDMLRGRSARLVSPSQLEILTWGSGSCPAVPDRLVVESPHAIRIDLALGSWKGKRLVTKPLPNGCTLDLRTTWMLVRIDPAWIDVRRPLTVRFYYRPNAKPEVTVAPPLRATRARA